MYNIKISIQNNVNFQTMGWKIQMLEKKDKLTEIEEQIIYLISKELGNKEIAEKLNYSQRSIGYKINNIFKKLNVNSRIGVIIEAVKQNII